MFGARKKSLRQMSADEIKETVRERYSQVAKKPCALFNFPVGKTFAMEKVGFSNIEVISKIRNARTGHRLAVCANIRALKGVKQL